MPPGFRSGDRVVVEVPRSRSLEEQRMYGGRTGVVQGTDVLSVGAFVRVRMDDDHPATGGPWIPKLPEAWLERLI